MLCQIVLRLIWFWLSAFLSSSRSDRGSVPESGLELFLWFFVWMSEFPTIVCPEYNICENLLTSVFIICVFFTVESKYLWTQTNRDVCFIQKKNIFVNCICIHFFLVMFGVPFLKGIIFRFHICNKCLKNWFYENACVHTELNTKVVRICYFSLFFCDIQVKLNPYEQVMPAISKGWDCWILKSNYCWLFKSNSSARGGLGFLLLVIFS